MKKPTKKQVREELAEIFSKAIPDLGPKCGLIVRKLLSGNFVLVMGRDPQNYSYIVASSEEAQGIADYINAEFRD